MYRSQDEAKFLAEFIANETKDLRERIEKLEAAQPQKSKPPKPTVWPAKGDWYRFLGKNGYEFELTAARNRFEVGKDYLVEDCNVQSWSHSIKFDGMEGWYNGVMFERVTDTRPDRNSET